MSKMIHIVAFTLVVVGALNWGLIGLLDFNLVTTLVGQWPTFEKLVYILVGVSAVYELAMHPKSCKMCSMKSK